MAKPKVSQQARAAKERGTRTTPRVEAKLKNWGTVKGQQSLFD